MKTKSKRILSILLALTVAVTMGLYIPIGTAFAEEIGTQEEMDAQESTDNSEENSRQEAPEATERANQTPEKSQDTALTVKLNGETEKTFTMEALQAIATEEGNKTYTFSAWNTYPTFSTYPNITGPTVEAIIAKAGLTDSVTETGTVEFTGSGYTKALTGRQLIEERYYYPNGNLVEQETGNVPEDACEGKVEAPAVISLSGDTCLYVGQAAPNEENNPLFIKYMAKGGEINISTKTADRCSQVVVDKESGSLLPEGTEITISKGEGSNTNMEYDKIYYTFEGTSPGYGCPIYNCGPKQEMFCKPVCRPDNDPSKPEHKNRKITLKVRVKGYGKQDSILQSFTYYVGDALTVKVNGDVKKSYATLEDVKAAGESASSDYSGFNTYPSLSEKKRRTGIKVDSIIEDATGASASSLNKNALITFTGVDGYTTKLTAGQLFADRYYYPNAKAGTDNTGGPVKEAAYKDKAQVPAIIGTDDDKNSLLFGQTEPNEQNFAECVDGMLKIGQINIDTIADLEQCKAVTEATPSSDSIVEVGQKIEFPYPDEANKRDKICYVIDPEGDEEPGLADGFYNYSAYRYYEKLTNPPVFTKVGKHTIKVKVIGYGKLDSKESTFTYTVVAGKVSGFNAKSDSYNTIGLSWDKTPGAVGYEIYRKSGKSYKLLKTITSSATTSYKNTGLTAGTSYSYGTRAVFSGNQGETIKGDFVYTSAKPVPSATTVTLKAGKKSATVKWKKVAGASGYQVYRSMKSSSGFKNVKTIKKGSKTSYSNKKLKKGKTYYYKVRAYKTVSKKKVYGSFSTVKSIKAK